MGGFGGLPGRNGRHRFVESVEEPECRDVGIGGRLWQRRRWVLVGEMAFVERELADCPR